VADVVGFRAAIEGNDGGGGGPPPLTLPPLPAMHGLIDSSVAFIDVGDTTES